jgi:2-keto-4-pentenoate hydratase/2-oxohepta-3-ene-1,7-dioic acid hydratase in catechol pathway
MDNLQENNNMLRSTIAVLAIQAFFVLAIATLPSELHAQGMPSGHHVAEPFKLGTFEIDDEDRVGIVLRDEFVVELSAANRELERNFQYPAIPMPEHMLGLVERYEYGMQRRVYEVVNHVVARGQLNGDLPAYIHRVEDIRTLAPIRRPYPSKILNAAVNYFDHISEGAPEEQRLQAIADREQDPGTPYLFHKSVRGAVIGQGDTIVIPYGRDRADWENELAVVIGRNAKYVPATEANDYIFGYTILIDVSDRGGHPNRGSDWFVGKGHDTHTPMGPWIVPKEFFSYPDQDVHQRTLLSGAVMQDSGTEDMIHSVAELIEYGSSVMTLFPGDVIGAGSPSGVGSGIWLRGYQWFMQDGDELVVEIEGIGTLRHPVVQEQSRPEGTGSFLPPAPWDPSEAPATPWDDL